MLYLLYFTGDNLSSILACGLLEWRRILSLPELQIAVTVVKFSMVYSSSSSLLEFRACLVVLLAKFVSYIVFSQVDCILLEFLAFDSKSLLMKISI